MKDLREYLEELGLVKEGEEGLIATARQVQEYLKTQTDEKVDLSAVTVSEKLVITDMHFESFNACTCDFNGGIEIKNCTFNEFLNFQGAYVRKLFKLEKVIVGIDLDMPENITELKLPEIDILNLQVKGRILIDQP